MPKTNKQTKFHVPLISDQQDVVQSRKLNLVGIGFIMVSWELQVGVESFCIPACGILLPVLSVVECPRNDP